MTDRFVLHASKEAFQEMFDVTSERDDYFEANYNIGPGERVPVIFIHDGERTIHEFLWGLIPQKAKSEKEGTGHTVTPSEDILVEDNGNEELEEAFATRRCLVPANGFYKWKTSKKKSTPFYIRLLDNEVIGLAGIYSVWQSDSGRDVYSFSLITTESNALVQPVDDRMPVILRPDQFQIWLQEESFDKATSEELFRPYPLTEMAVNRVSEKVNDPTNNGPELIQPIPK